MPVTTVNKTTYICDGCNCSFVKDNTAMYFGGQPWSTFELQGITPTSAASIRTPKYYCLCNGCSCKVDYFISEIEKRE